MAIEQRYLDSSYLIHNPNWHREDAPWKAKQVLSILKEHQINPASVCEVGCGAGDILLCLGKSYPHTALFGYDISPQAAKFWTENLDSCGGGVVYTLGNFHEQNTTQYDVLLMLDVFEHVRDPFTFLEDSHRHGKKFVFHIPLDLSAMGIARKASLLNARRGIGHLHYYTKDLALETLTDSGYQIIDWRYTGASQCSPNRSLKTRFASTPRQLANLINKDWGVRLFGGETLIVLAE